MEILKLTLEEVGRLFVSCLPVGFLIGCFPLIIGVVVKGLFDIFKRA